MFKKTEILLLLGILSSCIGCAVPMKGVRIAEKGSAQAVIIIGQDAPEPEQHAAAELAEFLSQITGADFSVVNPAAVVTNKSRVLVGPQAAKLADHNFSTDGLGQEGIVIHTIGSDLILAGGYPRGTLYAVYTFLEDYTGCRWWSSKVSTIPKKPTLIIENIDLRYIPKFEFRESFWTDACDGDFAVRNK